MVVRISAGLLRMLLYLQIATLLYVKEGNTQECRYSVYQQNLISCSNMATNKELRNQIDDTLSPYGNITWVINILELTQCNLLNLTINELSFLSELQELYIRNSNVSTLSSRNPDERINDN
ncbi:hypothetical protein ILUMI_03899, partial [Ignelater luminosus]